MKIVITQSGPIFIKEIEVFIKILPIEKTPGPEVNATKHLRNIFYTNSFRKQNTFQL